MVLASRARSARRLDQGFPTQTGPARGRTATRQYERADEPQGCWCVFSAHRGRFALLVEDLGAQLRDEMGVRSAPIFSSKRLVW